MAPCFLAYKYGERRSAAVCQVMTFLSHRLREEGCGTVALPLINVKSGVGLFETAYAVLSVLDESQGLFCGKDRKEAAKGVQRLGELCR